MLCEDGESSRSHGLPKPILEKQAENIGAQSVFRSASWDDYEEEFIAALKEFKKGGIDVGVFGDIDLAPHREWVERVCGIVGITPLLPLWKRKRRELLEEFIALGFTAQIIVVNEEKVDSSFLGKCIDSQSITDMEKAGIDPSGELGEYHTVVTKGPIFSSKVEVKIQGEEHQEGYRFLKMTL